MKTLWFVASIGVLLAGIYTMFSKKAMLVLGSQSILVISAILFSMAITWLRLREHPSIQRILMARSLLAAGDKTRAEMSNAGPERFRVLRKAETVLNRRSQRVLVVLEKPINQFNVAATLRS